MNKNLKKLQPNNENTVKLQEKYLLQHQPNTTPHTHTLRTKSYSDANQLLGALSAICLLEFAARIAVSILKHTK